MRKFIAIILALSTLIPAFAQNTRKVNGVVRDENSDVLPGAIVVVKNGRTYGVGAGQMNRVGSAGIALKQAEESLRTEGLDIRQAGLVMGSDGFFPFADSVETAAEYGIKAIVQPGGSVRDAESIEAANAHHIAMLFTGMRHFKH